MHQVLRWLGANWFNIITVTTAVVAVVLARRSHQRAQDSVNETKKMRIISEAEYHRKRTPRFRVELETIGEQDNIPNVKIEYIDGEDLETIHVTVEAAQGIRQLFYAENQGERTEAKVRKGDVRHLRITQPDNSAAVR